MANTVWRKVLGSFVSYCGVMLRLLFSLSFRLVLERPAYGAGQR